MLTRRDTIIGSATLLLTAATTDPLTRIAATLAPGRLGVAILDTATGRLTGHHANTRFALCSTFKLPLAAAVLAEVDRGRLSLAQPIRFTAADLLDHAPAVRAHLAAGRMTVAALAEAAVVLSDNAAANLLLPLVSGPAGLTRFCRAHGDRVTRMDRTEPTLNDVPPGELRDTTTPAAMAGLVRRLLLGDALTPASREHLIGWLVASPTGAKRLRAGFPTAWRAGDKTGTGPDGETNDVAIGWPTGRPPIIVAAYVDAPRVAAAAREATLAEVGRVVAATFDKQRRTA